MTRQRILLIVLLAWALVMIVPDVLRVVQPLGSFGFYADNDGMIYDVTGPFDETYQSPAWNAGIREGDRLALSKLRCFPYDPTTCGNALMVLGGHQYVLKGAGDVQSEGDRRPASAADHFDRGAGAGQPVRAIHRTDGSDRCAAAWLVWTRPGRMSWGFFLYVMWFNPGQYYAFYALLAQWPLVMLGQNIAGAIAEAVGYTGLSSSSCAPPITSLTANGDGSNASCQPSQSCSRS